MNLSSRSALAAGALALFLLNTGCKNKPTTGLGGAVEAKTSDGTPASAEIYHADPEAVTFDLAPTPDGSENKWTASYVSQGRTAKFGIDLSPAKSNGTGEIKIAFGEGRFTAVEGSDARDLLSELKKKLEAKHLPGKV